MLKLKNIKVLLGNVAVEYSNNGIFVQSTTILVNPNRDIEEQVIESIRNNSNMRQYDWTIIGEVFEYYAMMQCTESGFKSLREQGYFCREEE